MIITRLYSGLGNQMFQYAAGLALAEQHRTVLKLDVNWFRMYPEKAAHNRYGLSCFNITEQFATQPEIHRLRGRPLSFTERLAVKAARPLRFFQLAASLSQQGGYHSQRQVQFYPEFAGVPDDTYIEGLWQSEDFFRPVAPLLRQQFTVRYPIPPAAAGLARRIAASTPSAFMHFRRGDYVSDPRFSRELGAVGLDYFAAAERRLRQAFSNLTCYIFSDDIEAVATDYRPQGPHEFVRDLEALPGHEALRLMSLCQHAIISNSTFSWWGAWLIDSNSKTVIAPEPWYANPVGPNPGPVPPVWTKLPRS
jgi:hypothetical protein